MQSWEDCITGTHESSFWKRQLVRQVAPDAGADHLVGLPDVDRLAVVIEEGVFIALTTPKGDAG
jgi:hypothetical protein